MEDDDDSQGTHKYYQGAESGMLIFYGEGVKRSLTNPGERLETHTLVLSSGNQWFLLLSQVEV